MAWHTRKWRLSLYVGWCCRGFYVISRKFVSCYSVHMIIDLISTSLVQIVKSSDRMISLDRLSIVNNVDSLWDQMWGKCWGCLVFSLGNFYNLTKICNIYCIVWSSRKKIRSSEFWIWSCKLVGPWAKEYNPKPDKNGSKTRAEGHFC